jgi:hypothetical protein
LRYATDPSMSIQERGIYMMTYFDVSKMIVNECASVSHISFLILPSQRLPVALNKTFELQDGKHKASSSTIYIMRERLVRKIVGGGLGIQKSIDYNVLDDESERPVVALCN